MQSVVFRARLLTSPLLQPTYVNSFRRVPTIMATSVTSRRFKSDKSLSNWKIVPTGYGGLEPAFLNRATGESSYNPPAELTAEDISKLRGASRYIGSIQDIQDLIDKSKECSLDMDSSEIPGEWLVGPEERKI